MPAKSRWIRRLARLRALGEQATAAEVGIVLGISQRQAQRLTERVPASLLGNVRVMNTAAVVRELKSRSETLDCSHEIDRIQNLREKMDQWNRDISGPDHLIVAAPTRIVGVSLDGLPPGVVIRTGRIELDVDSAQDAVEKLLALCYAINNSIESFELAVHKTPC